MRLFESAGHDSCRRSTARHLPRASSGLPYPLSHCCWGVALVILGCSLFPVTAAYPAEMQYPLGIAASEDGLILLADRQLPGVWKITDNKLELFFEGSKKFRTPLNAVWCVGIDPKGRIVAGDSSTRDIYRFNADHKPEPLTKGVNAGIGIPWSIAFDPKGDIYVSDLELRQIVKVPEAGGAAVKFAEVPAPKGIAMDAKGRLWVVSHGKDQLLRLSPEGKVETVVSGRPFQFPHNVAFDKDQNAYVSDGYAKTIWKIDATGKPAKWVEGKPLLNPVGIAWQGERLLIADPHAKAVFEVNKDGKPSRLELKSP